ncbi:MAG: peptide chain release factor 1 [Ruminococcaceae bacterium]|nr:peptide chain release factor 1 [Oscillospiraceae bacterium]
MPESYKSLLEQIERIEAQMNAPETYADPALFARLARERKALEPAAAAYRRAAELEADIAAAQELGFSAGEIAALCAEKAEAERAAQCALLPQDPNDGRSVIMELRSGTGGEEAALFAADLFRMYSMYADKKGWSVELASVSRTELGGIKEAVFTLEGEGAWRRMKYESGAHCVKRVPETESSGRIQTSIATVAVLPEVDELDFSLDMKDVRIDVFRASGAGGQKVNKTSSAIRVTYLPTGLVVECQDERSQLQNKERALSILRSRLYEAAQREQNDAVAARRRSQVGSGGRSERIRTYFFLRGQVVDQRLTGEERAFRLESILDGDLDEIIDCLIANEQAEKLKAQNE